MHEFILPSIGLAILAALTMGVGYLIGSTTTQAAATRKLKSVRALEQRTLRHVTNHRARLRDARRLLESACGADGAARAIAQLLALDAEFLREFADIQRDLEQLVKGIRGRQSKPSLDDGPLQREPTLPAAGNESGDAPTNQEPLLASSDTRREIRHNCRMIHRIAPYDNGSLPKRDQFREYEGRDISSKGFSFAATSHPSFTMLIVAIGQPPRLTYLTARVANVVETVEEGRRYHRVGCAFTGRLHNSLFEEH